MSKGLESASPLSHASLAALTNRNGGQTRSFSSKYAFSQFSPTKTPTDAVRSDDDQDATEAIEESK